MLKEKHKGDLDLRGKKYMELPQAFELDGDLRLEGSRLLESLPKKLKVTGRLCLDNTQITELPENLEVGDDLNLNYVPIKSLPEGLKVGGDLFLGNTKIQSLPKGLEVGKNIIINDSSQIASKYTVDELKQMCAGVKGDVEYF